MNDAIDQLLAPLENLSRHPKVRLLTWIVLVGSFIGDTLYSIVHKIQTDGISDNIAIALMTCLIIPAVIYLPPANLNQTKRKQPMENINKAKDLAQEIINESDGFLVIAVKPDGVAHIVTAISSEMQDAGVINGIMTFIEHRDREQKKRIDQNIDPDITIH